MNTPQDFNKFTDIFVRILFLWKNIFYIKFGYWLTFILNVKSLESLSVCVHRTICTGIKFLKIQDEDSHVSKTETDAGNGVIEMTLNDFLIELGP